MSFLYPLFFAGAVAIALPIVLHLLRRDVAPEVPFAAVRLLTRMPIEQTRRRRLRDLLLLAARIAALLLLAAAFARPYLVNAGAGMPMVVVAVDRSFSMTAPGSFARAVAIARETIDAAGGARLAVIAFDDRADLLLGGGTAAEARAVLDGLQPGYGSTRYAPMISRAIESAGDSEARLVVITDLQRTGWDGEAAMTVPPNLKVELRAVQGGIDGNAAVADTRLDGDAITAQVRNAGRDPMTGAARLTLDGKAVASAPFQARPGDATGLRFSYRLPRGSVVAVEIDDPKGYSADNRRFLLPEAAVRPRVLVVTGDADNSGLYLTRALQAADADRSLDLRVRAAATIGAMPPDEAAGCRAVVLLSTRRLDRRGRDLLSGLVRRGAGLFVAASEEVDPAAAAEIMDWPGFVVQERTADRVLAATDLRHPIFRPFGPIAANLGQLRFRRAWNVPGSGAEVAARFTDGSAALLERRGRSKILVFASDLDQQWNDFPLHPAFVPFVLEAVRYVAVDGPARREYLVGEAPPGVQPVPGTYVAGEDGRRIVVNVDLRESSTAVMQPEEFAAMLSQGGQTPPGVHSRRAEALEARLNLWRYGLILMLVALVAESAVGRAR